MKQSSLSDFEKQITEEGAKAVFEALRQHSITEANFTEYCALYRRFARLKHSTKDAAAQATSFYQQKLRPCIKDTKLLYELDITAIELKTAHFLPNTQLSFESVSSMRDLTVYQVTRLAVSFSRQTHLVSALRNAIIALRMDPRAANDVLGVLLDAGRIDLVDRDWLDADHRTLVDNLRDKGAVQRFLCVNEQNLAEKRQYAQYARALLLSDVLNGDYEAIRRASSVLIDGELYDLNVGVYVHVDYSAVREVGGVEVRQRCD